MRAMSLVLAMLLVPLMAFGQAEAPASSAEWPTEVVSRPVTLAPLMVEIRGDTLNVNLSKDMMAKPISLAPDVYIGLLKNLTVGLTHETGICLTGTDGGCAKFYNDLGLDIIAGGHSTGSTVAFHGGIQFRSFSEPGQTGVNLGVLARINIGSMIALVLDPRLYLGVTNRDKGDKFQDGFVELPLFVQVQVTSQLNAYLRTGIAHTLWNFTDDFPGEIPFGIGATFAINNRMDAGAEFLFPFMLGEDGSADLRFLHLRFAYRL